MPPLLRHRTALRLSFRRSLGVEQLRNPPNRFTHEDSAGGGGGKRVREREREREGERERERGDSEREKGMERERE